jgi:hypothetical protein
MAGTLFVPLLGHSYHRQSILIHGNHYNLRKETLEVLLQLHPFFSAST